MSGAATTRQARADAETLALAAALQSNTAARAILDALRLEDFRPGLHRQLFRLVTLCLTRYGHVDPSVVEAAARDEGEAIKASGLAELLLHTDAPQYVEIAVAAIKARRRKGKGDAAEAGPLPDELKGRRIHPALHFEDGFASVGILAPGHEGLAWSIVTGERKVYPASAIEGALTVKPAMLHDVASRWPEADCAVFLAAPARPPSFAVAVALALERVRALMDISNEVAAVLATWAVATYFHPLFKAFPRLDLRGEKGSGKSKALEILAAVAFNGGVYANPTAAVLHRIADPLRPSLCLDEVEHLDGEEKQAILSFLNMGYKRTGRVPRCEGDEHTLRTFAAYCPVALAGIRGLNSVTEDRAITLTLTRGADRAKINAEVDETEPRFAEARAVCYRLALTRGRDVAESRRTLALPDWLVGRERELWAPLLTVAHLAEADAGEDLGLTADLLGLAKVQGEEREGLSDEGEAVVSLLSDSLKRADSLTIRPADLCEDLTKALHLDKAIRPERVGRLLKRLGFARAPRGAGGVRYVATAERIATLRARYGGQGEETYTDGKPTLPNPA